MKLLVLPLLALLGASSLTADPGLPGDRVRTLADAAQSQNSVAWSVVGQWQCTHPVWADTVTISSDGTFSRATKGVVGHWSLTGLRDHAALVLDWDRFPAEAFPMVSPDEFRGRVRGPGYNGEFEMRRIQAPTADAVEIRHWHQGDPPLRLIRKEEGFCALLSVSGHFQGGGEQVRVYIGEDGCWYLGGKSMQQGVDAECIVVRFPAASPASAAPTPAPAEAVNILAASFGCGSDYADVTARVKDLLREGTVFQANPTWLLGDPKPYWNKALVIFCEVRGRRAIFSVGEGENVSRELLLKNARPVAGKT